MDVCWEEQMMKWSGTFYARYFFRFFDIFFHLSGDIDTLCRDIVHIKIIKFCPLHIFQVFEVQSLQTKISLIEKDNE